MNFRPGIPPMHQLINERIRDLVRGVRRFVGIEAEYEWISKRDDKVRETHRKVDGEVRKDGERFSNGLRWPRDPFGTLEETMNCRCERRRVR